MSEDININPEIESKIESELFALIKSIINLNNKFQTGKINENFFRKALKNAMNNLFKINLFLKEKNLLMENILDKMSLSQEYDDTINIINRIASLDIVNEDKLNQNIPFLELPGFTSQITSSFITLMDALTLNELEKYDFIISLFDELINGLRKFPGVEDLLLKVESTKRIVLNNIEKLNYDTKFREKIIDQLYLTFKEFQTKLNVSP